MKIHYATALARIQTELNQRGGTGPLYEQSLLDGGTT